MKRPYITVKFAQTLDGRIAARDGSSKWISTPPSLRFAHKLRSESDAVLVGVGTILKDNPSLTTRLVKGKNPIRVVIDARLRTPLRARIAKNTESARTIIVTTPNAPGRKIENFRKKGVEITVLSASKHGNIDIKKIIRILYKKGIKKILVEGGKKIITYFLKYALADKIIAVISPKILGKGVDTVGDLNIKSVKSALRLRLGNIEKSGGDIIYTAYILK